MRRHILVLALAWSLTTVGCGQGADEDVTSNAPVIVNVSKDAIVVGETLEFFGRHFVKATSDTRVTAIDDRLRLNFKGIFIDTFGEKVQVDLSVSPNLSIDRDNPMQQTLAWRRVGPFNKPFTGDARIGRFEGTVSISRQSSNGDEVQSEPAPFVVKISEHFLH